MAPVYSVAHDTLNAFKRLNGNLYLKCVHCINPSRFPRFRNSAYHLWRKLSHVVLGVAQFKRGNRKSKTSESSQSRPEGKVSSSEVSLDAISRDSADSGGFVDNGEPRKIHIAKETVVLLLLLYISLWRRSALSCNQPPIHYLSKTQDRQR